MKTYLEYRSTILDLDIKRLVVSFTLRLLYPPGENPPLTIG
jgi:hypothetical protein